MIPPRKARKQRAGGGTAHPCPHPGRPRGEVAAALWEHPECFPAEPSPHPLGYFPSSLPMYSAKPIPICPRTSPSLPSAPAWVAPSDRWLPAQALTVPSRSARARRGCAAGSRSEQNLSTGRRVISVGNGLLPFLLFFSV